MKQEASQRATDGPQPDRSDAEEFQAESRHRQGGKVPGGGGGGGRGARGTRKGGALLVVKRRANA